MSKCSSSAPLHTPEITRARARLSHVVARGRLLCRSFKRSSTEKILAAVLKEKMEFTNERDKKGRLSFVYNSDDSGETIREIVEACQQQVIGTRRARVPSSGRNVAAGVLAARCGCC